MTVAPPIARLHPVSMAIRLPEFEGGLGETPTILGVVARRVAAGVVEGLFEGAFEGDFEADFGAVFGAVFEGPAAAAGVNNRLRADGAGAALRRAATAGASFLEAAGASFPEAAFSFARSAAGPAVLLPAAAAAAEAPLAGVGDFAGGGGGGEGAADAPRLKSTWAPPSSMCC